MKLHLQTLVASHLHAGSTREPATPIPPEERLRPESEGMEHQTDRARLGGGVALPLAVLAQWAGTTMVDAGPRDQAQTPVGLSAPLVQGQRLTCKTAQRPIRLESNVATGKATSFPGRTRLSRSIARGRSGMVTGRSTRGRTHGIGMQVMAQFQAELPHPWTADLPCLLSPGGRTPPAVGVVLPVFISERRFQ